MSLRSHGDTGNEGSQKGRPWSLRGLSGAGTLGVIRLGQADDARAP